MTDLTPGPELDALVHEKIMGFPRKCMFPVDYSTDLYFIPSGKPKRTHMIDARPVPRYSRDDGVALQALERFAERHNCSWRVGFLNPNGFVRLRDGPFVCTIYSGDLSYTSPSLEIDRHAPTLAMAIVRALLAAVEEKG